MYSKTYYEPGTWNFECQDCGSLYKRNQCRKRWDGFIVCSTCWDPKPPQEYPERKHKGTIPAKEISKSSKKGMEDDYDADDHTLTFSD